MTDEERSMVEHLKDQIKALYVRLEYSKAEALCWKAGADIYRERVNELEAQLVFDEAESEIKKKKREAARKDQIPHVAALNEPGQPGCICFMCVSKRMAEKAK